MLKSSINRFHTNKFEKKIRRNFVSGRYKHDVDILWSNVLCLMQVVENDICGLF
jgi:methyl coenzyme M reductase beta subunit